MQKVLIANRGEIAVRVIRACHDLGLQTIAVYSEADSEALHVLHADEAICIGEPPSQKSYLKIPNILSACEITGADAIHPGYGFLSENHSFASICESCGLEFIGPSAKAIQLLGDKARAKETAAKANCPIIPGSDGVVEDMEKAIREVEKIGFPVFIKATAGGGGKGIRISHSMEEFKKHFAAARAEAEVSFGNPNVYLEKMIVNPRHIEVQVLGDKFGNVVHIGIRDCTIQRRRQKLIEETPCPILSKEKIEEIGEAAVRVVREAGYYSAGTVEFLLDSEGRYYFMEVNTRIQVEHTVSEELADIDLIEQQIRVARGEPLPFTQKDITFSGHVIQFRINAEDPSHHFMPSPGKLEYYLPPGGPHVRVDSACYSGYVIPPNYDSMVAKLIVKGRTREEAIARAKRALREFHVGGIKTTIPFHLYMLEDPNFLRMNYDLNYIDKLIADGCRFTLD
ncbi:acetyl-CoA carboxylase biotin carboxylase subunit [Estrella lausannensis]|uniref:Biotin carboxylase n=1 Tax=Estrella lausannensis TaxID=483423 RepID=A0A0H5DSI9_9BACT|nr:acetyl-CoA carboxylase biotin carboxylase subunit [Estrella lausannensis]CRX39268.1 Biotin carboxylase [Estrella lausannensis]